MPSIAQRRASRPRDWLMVLIAIDGAPEGLDPVRLQKAMFLFAREGGLEPTERYWFVPYAYGPMSPALYRDLRLLVDEGLVERRAVSGHSWARYAPTRTGRREGARLAREICPEAVERLGAVKRRVAASGFAALLADVQARYPRYAARSVFRRA